MTALSPLQYQKHLRLQEARRLMLSEALDAASAGYQVGYQSSLSSAVSTAASSVRRPGATSPASEALPSSCLRGAS